MITKTTACAHGTLPPMCHIIQTHAHKNQLSEVSDSRSKQLRTETKLEKSLVFCCNKKEEKNKKPYCKEIKFML